MTPEEGRQVAQQALELLKITGEGFSLLAWYTATVVQTLAWPAVVFGIGWIFRKPIAGLIEGIGEFVFEYKGVKVSLKKALDKVAKEYPRVEEKVRKAIEIAATTKAGGGISVTAVPTIRTALGARAQALRDSMGRDLEHLEKLSNVTATAPVAAMIGSWAILKKNSVETAKLHGLVLS